MTEASLSQGDRTAGEAERHREEHHAEEGGHRNDLEEAALASDGRMVMALAEGHHIAGAEVVVRMAAGEQEEDTGQVEAAVDNILPAAEEEDTGRTVPGLEGIALAAADIALAEEDTGRSLAVVAVVLFKEKELVSVNRQVGKARSFGHCYLLTRLEIGSYSRP